jgi:choline kinase
LLRTSGDIAISVDSDWRASYLGRAEHPSTEAEKVYVDEHGRAVRLGKYLSEVAPVAYSVQEFTGILRTTARGTRVLVDTFRELDSTLSTDSPFQAAACWSQAYLTDLLQECIDRGEPVCTAPVERGWLEFDTPEDYRRFPERAERQRLELPFLRRGRG